MSILIQSTLSHLREAELAFDNAKLVLNLGSGARLVSVPATLFLSQFSISATLLPGKTRCADNPGVNDSAPGHFQAIFLEVLIYQMEQMVTQIMFFHQMKELTDHDFVRSRFPSQVNADESPQRGGIVQDFFCRWTRQVEPVLDKMNTQRMRSTPTGRHPTPSGLG